MVISANLAAALSMIAASEGTDRAKDSNGVLIDAYRTTFQGELSPGVKKPMYITRDLTWHPAEHRPDGTREWTGESLAFLGPRYVGEISTAAGRYQITLPTFLRLKSRLHLYDCQGASQDACAIELITEQGARPLIEGGQLGNAISLLHPIWASLPGSTAGQPITSFASLMSAYTNAGGGFA